MSDIAERLKAHAYCLAIVNPDVENKSAILMREAADFISEGTLKQKRVEGILREMKLALLGYPMSVRSLTPTALLNAINRELDVQVEKEPK